MKSPTSKNVILASGSPRRHELLKEIVPEFTIAPSRDIEEVYPDNLAVEDIAAYLSALKADAYSDLLDNSNLIITADTVVVADNKILGKPHNEEEALDMLETLSGNTHKVITGVTIMSLEKCKTFSCETYVHFDKISKEELRKYIKEFQPLDKAGAYGIQEWIGCRGINKIEGCFYNVMGLPLNLLYKHLCDF